MDAIISIIMPAYNAAEHLDFSIQSVLNQTFTKWELIIVNDGSTDETAQIINDWAKKEARIRVFHQKNTGVASARNLALSHCNGLYVTMLDADDELASCALELMFKQMVVEPEVDMVTAGFCEVFKSSGDVIHRGGLLMGRQDKGIFAIDDAFVVEYMHCGVCSKLYKLSLLKQSRIEYQKSLKIGEDHLFSLQYLQHCRKAAVLQAEIYRYIHWSDSAISRFDTGKLSDQTYIDAITLYSNLILPVNKKWGAALLSHFLRVFYWVRRIITVYRPSDWHHIQFAAYKALPRLLYRAGFFGSLRMLLRWMKMC